MPGLAFILLIATWLLKAGDVFFFVFHSSLVVFNTFGWAHRKMRPYHLASMLITAFSWFVMGIWYGWGYCLCTDVHWDIRQQLGYNDGTNTYIGLLVRKLTGARYMDETVDLATGIVFFLSLALTVTLNLKDISKRMNSSQR